MSRYVDGAGCEEADECALDPGCEFYGSCLLPGNASEDDGDG
jgi:hypothetical protein